MLLDTLFLYIKLISGVLGSFLLLVGGSIEPQVGVWVVSVGGSLLAIALGPDKNFWQVCLYLICGLFWGIFGSQVIHAISPIPQPAAAFFSSIFGSEATFYVMRSLRQGDMSNFFLALVEKINPFSGMKEK